MRISPPLKEIQVTTESDFKIVFGIDKLGKMFLLPLATVISGLIKIIYQSASRVEQNIYPDLCDDEMLLRHGFIRLNRYPYPARFGQYLCSVSCTQIGTIIRTGTQFRKDDKIFIIESDYTFSGLTGAITLVAGAEGSSYSLDPNDELECLVPIANFNGFATVGSVVIIDGEEQTPVNAETLAEYRENVIKSYVTQVNGGCRSSYRNWTESSEGIREVYPYTSPGYVTEVDLYIEAFAADSTDGYGTPSQDLINGVISDIEPSNIPLGVANINYKPIRLVDVEITIVGLMNPSQEQSISSSIESFLYGVRPYIAGADLLSEENKGRLVYNDIYGIIYSITKGLFTSFDLKVNGQSVTSYTFTDGYIPKFLPLIIT